MSATTRRRARPARGIAAGVAIAVRLGVACAEPQHDPLPVAIAAVVPLPDPTVEAEARASYQQGAALLGERRSVEAVPYLARAVGLRPDLWQCHSDYGVAVANATLESVSRRGHRAPWTRSSWERAGLLREAMSQMNLAERLATAPVDLAYVRHLRGRVLRNWGLHWEALFDLEDAARSDPQWRAEWRAHQASLGLPTAFETPR